MSMRISSLILLPLAIAGCGERRADQATLAKAEAEQGAAAEDEGRVLCAHSDGDFARVCTIDREQTDTGLILTIHHPDGAFHRLLVTTDGRGVVAADGAQKAVVTVIGPDRIGVSLAGDHYQLPATVESKSKTAS